MALLQNSIAEAKRSKRNRTFTLHLRSMFTQSQFHGKNLHYCSDRFTWSTNAGSVMNCEKNTSHIHNYVYIWRQRFHLGDVVVLKDRKSMLKETRTFDKGAAE